MSHKVLIAVPAMDTMPTRTAYDMLSLQRDCPSKYSFIVRASCHDARNMLAAEALDTGVDRVLWIDSDMAFPRDMMIRMGADLDAGWDMVCGIFFKRQFPLFPVIYKSCDSGTGETEVYQDYPKDSIFPVEACGFGAVMMTAELLKKVWDKFGEPFALMPALSEDLSFCARARSLGAKIACDSRIKVGHVGLISYGEEMKHPGG